MLLYISIWHSGPVVMSRRVALPIFQFTVQIALRLRLPWPFFSFIFSQPFDLVVQLAHEDKVVIHEPNPLPDLVVTEEFL